MTKLTHIYTLNKEIARVNKKIDQKILKGEAYNREARQHKVLRSQLRQIEKDAAFSRSFRILSIFA